MLRVLDLFSGIGGFSLGLERTGGFETVAFCEIDPFCRRVLAKHWPGVPIYDDVRTLTADALERDGIDIDVICGGFPCQDVSAVGARGGIGGELSGLWVQYARLIRELGPRYVIVENVTGLHDRGFGDVLRDLAVIGYDAEWSVLSACRLGTPHARERVFLVAYPNGERQEAGGSKGNGADAGASRRGFGAEHLYSFTFAACREDWASFACEPAVARVADGVPDRVDANGALGNAIVPLIPQTIGMSILAATAIGLKAAKLEENHDG